MTITPETMLEQLRIIAEKKRADCGGEDYVYQKPDHLKEDSRIDCFYVHYDEDGQASPGCIIGTWAHQDLGVELESFQAVEGVGAMTALADLRVEGFDGFAATAIDVIASRVQSEQDGGVPWLQAVELVQAQYEAGNFR